MCLPKEFSGSGKAAGPEVSRDPKCTPASKLPASKGTALQEALGPCPDDRPHPASSTRTGPNREERCPVWNGNSSPTSVPGKTGNHRPGDMLFISQPPGFGPSQPVLPGWAAGAGGGPGPPGRMLDLAPRAPGPVLRPRPGSAEDGCPGRRGQSRVAQTRPLPSPSLRVPPRGESGPDGSSSAAPGRLAWKGGLAWKAARRPPRALGLHSVSGGNLGTRTQPR